MSHIIEHSIHLYFLGLLGVMCLWLGSVLEAEGWLWIALILFIFVFILGYAL